MTDRIDDLLDSLLETGELPADATAAEREEVESLARAAGLMRATRDVTETEALATKPIARARFERFLADAQPVAEPASARAVRPAARESWFARFFATNRGLRGAGLAAAIGIIAILAVFASQNAFNRTESAVAQVLEPGDYAEVYGTVSSVEGEGDALMFKVNSEFGVLEITADDETSVVESNNVQQLTSIQPGANLLIAGLVGQDRRIAAQTLALAGIESTPVASATSSAQELKRTPPSEFEGRISLMTLAEDGLGAKVVVLADDGTRYVVRISRLNAGTLLTSVDRILGTRIHLIRAAIGGDDVYVARLARANVEPAATRTPATTGTTPVRGASAVATQAAASPAASGFTRRGGVIVSRDANVLTVKTEGGDLKVVIRTQTQVILDTTGLTRADILRGDTVIGHQVIVQGGIERVTGRFIADVIVVGAKP